MADTSETGASGPLEVEQDDDPALASDRSESGRQGGPASMLTRLLAVRRIRFVQGVVAVLVLLAGSLLADRNPLTDWWWWVGSVAVFTAAVIEPYFTSPSAALLYGIGALGTLYSADRDGVGELWTAFGIVAGVVTVAGMLALLTALDRLGDIAVWVATRLGRPLMLGVAALTIEIARVAAVDSLTTAGRLAIATFVAGIIASLDWYRLWALMPLGPTKLATIETAVEPNLLLISSALRPPRGTRVRVIGQGSANGVVASIRAHKSGARMEVVLESPWTHVASAAGTHCAVERLEPDPDGPVAFAAEGSSERVLALRPFGKLRYGATVYWADGQRRYLYQVIGLRLERDSWDGAAVVADRGSAQQIGAIGAAGRLEFAPALPKPYAPVYSAAEVSAPLPAGFVRLGAISGTKLEFGVSPASLREHHLAILGMSGMGKSTVSKRICELLKDASFVVAVDGTSEYRTRFGLSALDLARTSDDAGVWVYEPAGQPAQRAMEFIESLMTSANNEYAGGAAPRSRTVLM